MFDPKVKRSELREVVGALCDKLGLVYDLDEYELVEDDEADQLSFVSKLNALRDLHLVVMDDVRLILEYLGAEITTTAGTPSVRKVTAKAASSAVKPNRPTRAKAAGAQAASDGGKKWQEAE